MALSADAAMTWVSAVLVVLGLVGVLIPVMPGLALSLTGIVLWAAVRGSLGAWVVAALCAALYAVGVVLRYLLPGRRMRDQGVGTTSLLVASALAVVGLVVIPLLGAPIGFVLGIYLVEQARSGDRRQAWSRTRTAVHAVIVSTGIELGTGVVMATAWVVGMILEG